MYYLKDVSPPHITMRMLNRAACGAQFLVLVRRYAAAHGACRSASPEFRATAGFKPDEHSRV